MPSIAWQFWRIPKVTVKSKSLQGWAFEEFNPGNFWRQLKMLHALGPASLSLAQHSGDHLAQGPFLISTHQRLTHQRCWGNPLIAFSMISYRTLWKGNLIGLQPSSAPYFSPQLFMRDIPVFLHQVFDLSQNPVQFWRGIRPQFSRLWNRRHSLHNLSEGKIQALTENTLPWQRHYCYDKKMHMPCVLHHQHLKKFTNVLLSWNLQ